MKVVSDARPKPSELLLVALVPEAKESFSGKFAGSKLSFLLNTSLSSLFDFPVNQ